MEIKEKVAVGVAVALVVVVTAVGLAGSVPRVSRDLVAVDRCAGLLVDSWRLVHDLAETSSAVLAGGADPVVFSQAKAAALGELHVDAGLFEECTGRPAVIK